ncbi:phosphoesterase [Lysinibacillus alkalisoli]|uniref:Phosphoesterase n=1 Tax=Lysinibacillus alkalisoli TaxID=1911548 RepID=A0A917G869_9BACI|nr:metallophosphoesterase [Lysinibacillus alkalisoli]GGG27990.1 phosphoesterase [Lysinibacillus alkalisoli]
MTLIVMSDSHRSAAVIEQVKAKHPQATYIHCGDSELPFDHEALIGITIVKGNCDVDPHYSLEQVLLYEGQKVLIVHGHQHHVNQSPLSLVYRAQEVGASLVCFGHTHCAGFEQYDNVTLLNPGSLVKSRNELPEGYAIVEWRHQQWQVTIMPLL